MKLSAVTGVIGVVIATLAAWQGTPAIWWFLGGGFVCMCVGSILSFEGK